MVVRVWGESPGHWRDLCWGFTWPAIAAVCQAMLAYYQDRFAAGGEASVLNDSYLEQNRFKAMRFGLDGDIIEPESGEIVSMRGYLDRLFETVQGKCGQLGSSGHLAVARRIAGEGNEAQWQLERAQQLGGDLKALELEIAERTLA